MELDQVEALRVELAELQDRLLALPRDAFAERIELRERQEQLREAIRARVTSGDILSADQIRHRIEMLEARIERHYTNRISGSAAAITGFGGGIDPGVLHAMHRRMDTTAGLEGMRAELRHLRDRLAAMERGEPEPPPGDPALED